EPWLEEHKEVMCNWEKADELSELCAMGIFAFQRLKNHLPACNESFDKILNMRECFDHWYEATSAVSVASEALAGQEFEVNGLDQLQGALSEASSILSDLQDATTAIHAVRSKESKSLEEFLDEL